MDINHLTADPKTISSVLNYCGRPKGARKTNLFNGQRDIPRMRHMNINSFKVYRDFFSSSTGMYGIFSSSTGMNGMF